MLMLMMPRAADAAACRQRLIAYAFQLMLMLMMRRGALLLLCHVYAMLICHYAIITLLRCHFVTPRSSARRRRLLRALIRR